MRYLHLPAEPVKNTFWPALTMSSTACCSEDKTIFGARVILFRASAAAAQLASDFGSEGMSLATAGVPLLDE